jgi:hypothetical protein
MDIDVLQGRLPMRETERPGMGMQRQITNAELEARRLAPPDYQTVDLTRLKKSFDTDGAAGAVSCPKCGHSLAGGTCPTCAASPASPAEGEAAPAEKAIDVGAKALAKNLDCGPEGVNGMSAEDRILAKALAFQVECADFVYGLSKGLGEGTRGGKVIGHTKSGKPIYAGHGEHASPAHKEAIDHLTEKRGGHGGTYPEQAGAALRTAHPDYTAQDHIDAAEAHKQESNRFGMYDRPGQDSHTVARAHYTAADQLGHGVKDKPPLEFSESGDSHTASADHGSYRVGRVGYAGHGATYFPKGKEGGKGFPIGTVGSRSGAIKQAQAHHSKQ